ncbi:hypothetical protein B0H16DRAFT_1503484 [Mycena metata]|uniref:Protein kinase domain-containing protein n=1 Tax=Mycena metata TaxID=1033252 RepID=A0AAD7NWU0_9AGAR|nr:hypothetical protein B0H16DRAFT_1503484 [Mycena metata]
MAPELLDPQRFGNGKFARTPTSDVYAYGCVCFELYTGQPPYREPAALLKVLNGERPGRPSGPPAISDLLWAYVTQYWAESAVPAVLQSDIQHGLLDTRSSSDDTLAVPASRGIQAESRAAGVSTGVLREGPVSVKGTSKFVSWFWENTWLVLKEQILNLYKSEVGMNQRLRPSKFCGFGPPSLHSPPRCYQD